MDNFVTPHCHIQSLDSGSTPTAFAKREAELGTGALVVTDHGSLAACQTVYDLAKKGVEIDNGDGTKRKVKLSPILGLEGYFRDDNCPLFTAAGMGGGVPAVFKYGHFTTHFIDQAAFKTVIKLLSHAPIEKHGSEQKPLFNWKAMEELGAANATVTTGCLIGMVQRHLLDRQDPTLARAYYERLRAMVKPGNFYVEVFPHVCSHNWVAGVFLTLQEPGGQPFKLRFYAGKNLRTNVGDIKAEELAKAWLRKGNKHVELRAVKDYHTWNERTPAVLVNVEHVEDFIQNECRPFAPDGDVQLGANEWMIQIAKEYGDPILISDDSHYATPEEKVVQDVRLAQSGSWRFYGSYHRQSSAEAFEYFKNKLNVDEGTFQGWVENSHAWKERFKDFKLESKPDLPTRFYEVKYPEVNVKDSLGYTVHLIRQHGRMDWKNPVYVARLTQEINLLHRNGVIDLLPYFFIDEEVCRLYRDAGLLTGPGRGSAAGLLLTYLLGITHVDPIRYGLSVDRFLTVDRIRSGKLPDIDQDLPHRDLLVGEDGKGGWLQERFGECVAQISTIMTLKLRSAVLDVARFTLGEVPRDIAELTRKFEMPPMGLDDIKHVLGYEDGDSWVEGSITRDPALIAYVATYPEQWEIVKKCLGLGRGVSRHACAYVIANRPIWEFIPLTKISDITCTQFTAPAVEAAGGLKMDFLVINSLKDIAMAIKLAQERKGEPASDSPGQNGQHLDGKYVPSLRLLPHPSEPGRFVDIWDLPEDQKVFTDISTSKTETVFQFNTPGATQWLRHFSHQKDNGNFAIDSIEAMAAFTALDRPGPLDAKVRTPDTDEGTHNMLVEYARRARGAKYSTSIFEVFDRLFPETFGVMVYQEQLQRLYQEVTGCTGAEAEAFRGNVAKKLKEKVIAAYPAFIEGATKSMGSKESAEAVWQFINSWAAYGFNKSHAVCYVVIAYACAYLKHHYPLEWWTAVLCNADKNEINEKFWKHAGKLINLPDVTKAHPNFTIIDERIQAPLSLLHGVGETAHAELVAGAPFTSMADLVAKIEGKKAAGTTTKLVDEMEIYVDDNGEKKKRPTGSQIEKTVKGRSALNNGVVGKLIVSGAMDKLFADGTDTLTMLEQYEGARFDYENEVRRNLPKPKKPKKTPDTKWIAKAGLDKLTQYSRYQLRKGILPAYSESVLKMAIESGHSSIASLKGRWSYLGWLAPVPCASASGYERMLQASPPQDGSGIRIAIAGYVEDVRVFQYGARKEKRACDMTVDLDGHRVKFVRWPDRETGELEDGYDTSLKGALVVLVLSRFKDGKPFSIDHIETIQAAPGADKPEESPEESPEPTEQKEMVIV